MARTFNNDVANYLRRNAGSIITPNDPRPISIHCWFKAAARGQFHVFLQNNAFDVLPGLMWHLADAGGGQDKQGLTSNGNNIYGSNFTLSTTLYQTHGVSWAANDNLAFWLNGAANGTTTLAKGGTASDLATIGVYNTGVPTLSLNGDLYRISVWNMVLGSSDWAALALLDDPSTVQNANLVFDLKITGSADPEIESVGGSSWFVVGSLPSAADPVFAGGQPFAIRGRGIPGMSRIQQLSGRGW